MSERTTIGGTVYESVGSSSSNLLLKCNGTARIQWGNKLIDLVKNGKITSENSNELLFIIQDESEIKSDGIYILNNGESIKFLINKGGSQYYLPENNFSTGMIIMYSGLEEIPSGWVICDGKEYEIDGNKIKTPDLSNQFVKSGNYTDYSLIFIMKL